MSRSMRLAELWLTSPTTFQVSDSLTVLRQPKDCSVSLSEMFSESTIRPFGFAPRLKVPEVIVLLVTVALLTLSPPRPTLRKVFLVEVRIFAW